MSESPCGRWSWSVPGMSPWCLSKATTDSCLTDRPSPNRLQWMASPWTPGNFLYELLFSKNESYSTFFSALPDLMTWRAKWVRTSFFLMMQGLMRHSLSPTTCLLQDLLWVVTGPLGARARLLTWRMVFEWVHLLCWKTSSFSMCVMLLTLQSQKPMFSSPRGRQGRQIWVLLCLLGFWLNILCSFLGTKTYISHWPQVFFKEFSMFLWF